MYDKKLCNTLFSVLRFDPSNDKNETHGGVSFVA